MTDQPLPDRMYADARGYFAFPLGPADAGLAGLAQWQVYAEQLAAAKRGRFDALPALLEHYDHDADWVRRGAYVQLLGDAGPDALLERVHGELLSEVPLDYVYDFGEMLALWGRLDVVPTLLEIYRANYDFDDGRFIPPRVIRLLVDEPDALEDPPYDASAEDADAFVAAASELHGQLREQLGERAFVFRGRLLDVEWVARRSLADLGEGRFDSAMRHKFEAMTGIDCSSFYAKRKLDPLAAAVVLEDFLANPARARFVAGRRYFFAHPVA